MSDRNKTLIAIAASILLHLLGFLFLVFWTLIHPEQPLEAKAPERKQVEVTIMRNPPKKAEPEKAITTATPPPAIKEKPRTIDT
ncbi:MAG: hypothetical protein WCH43_00840, partial [Verrucomicrobiota bacterium]